ncbi:MAG: hypothetical protein V7K48_10370 [Nostoc sp.]|uniref:hypothetical protein n=1 Tax=Nostoc sp. TaxID=1180 RepID=UPI002FF5CE89
MKILPQDYIYNPGVLFMLLLVRLTKMQILSGLNLWLPIQQLQMLIPLLTQLIPILYEAAYNGEKKLDKLK